MGDAALEIVCLVDGAHGIYVPQILAERMDSWLVQHGADPEDVEIVRKGPDEACYWEAWDNILSDFVIENDDGSYSYLEHDQDVFLVTTI